MGIHKLQFTNLFTTTNIHLSKLCLSDNVIPFASLSPSGNLARVPLALALATWMAAVFFAWAMRAFSACSFLILMFRVAASSAPIAQSGLILLHKSRSNVMSLSITVWHFAWIAKRLLDVSELSEKIVRHFKNHRENILAHRLQCKNRVFLPTQLPMLIRDLFDELLESARGNEGPFDNPLLIMFYFTKGFYYMN